MLSGAFFRYSEVFLIRTNAIISNKPLIINYLFRMYELHKCLAYLRQKKSWRKINERFVRFFHAELKPRTYKDYNRYFPIPQNNIDNNPKLAQNEGYSKSFK